MMMMMIQTPPFSKTTIVIFIYSNNTVDTNTSSTVLFVEKYGSGPGPVHSSPGPGPTKSGPVHPLTGPDTRTYGVGPVRTQVREGQDRTPDNLCVPDLFPFCMPEVIHMRMDGARFINVYY